MALEPVAEDIVLVEILIEYVHRTDCPGIARLSLHLLGVVHKVPEDLRILEIPVPVDAEKISALPLLQTAC